MSASPGTAQEMHGPRAIRIDDRRSGHTSISPRARRCSSLGEDHQ
jgi:hypothetical protein